MESDTAGGFVPAATHDYRMQMDPRAVDQMRLYQAANGLKDGDSMILFHAFVPLALDRFRRVKGDLEHLSGTSANLITRRGSVKQEFSLRRDDWKAIREFFEEMGECCLILAKDPVSTLQAFLVVEGER